MKSVCLFLGLFAAALAPAAATQDHPIVKVIEMLDGLAAKAKAEGEEEGLAYEKFEYWVKTSVKELNGAIKTETEDIDELNDVISGKTKEEEVLKEQIAKLQEELQKLDAEQKESNGNRRDQEGVYMDKKMALELTIEGVEDCLTALKGSQGNTDTGLIQSKLTKILPFMALKASDSEMALLQDAASRPTQKAKGDKAGAVKGYAFKSGSVIELLKGLETKFQEELLATEKAETNSVNAFELANQARDDLVSAATESKNAKDTTLSEVQQALAKAKGDLSDRQEDLADDSATLEATQKDSSIKASEWAERSKTRASEIEAIKVAIEILSKTTGVRTEAPSNPVPPPSPIALLQIKAQSSDPKMKAIELLHQTAKVAKSKVLEQFANTIAAHLSGPFDKVNNEMEKMIFRLMDEQKKEDEHKLWCDQELKQSETSRDDKADKVAELNEKIEAAVAKSAQLVQAIADAQTMVADITAHMKEATEIREVGKEENKLAIKDSEDAQTAVSDAIAVLEEFYKSSGAVPKESWEFVQTKTEGDVDLAEKPSTWGSSYSGVADPKNPTGILSVLEEISKDFAEMEAETRAQEQEDQDLHDKEMSECSIEKARRAKEAEMKQQEQKRTDTKIEDMEKTKKGVNKELDAVKQYLDDLKPACVNGDSSYEDRKAARDMEIAGIKQAKGILKDAFGKQPGTFLQKRA